MAARCVATATATCSECGLAVVFVMAPPLDGARQLGRYGTRYAVSDHGNNTHQTTVDGRAISR
jgi:hypothetical protein